jgi:hypothetical protein
MLSVWRELEIEIQMSDSPVPYTPHSGLSTQYYFVMR